MSLQSKARSVMGGKSGKRTKARTVKLGKKGSFKIKHPGAFRAAAKRAGKSTMEMAEEHQHDKGTLGNRARAALGFAAMKH